MLTLGCRPGLAVSIVLVVAVAAGGPLSAQTAQAPARQAASPAPAARAGADAELPSARSVIDRHIGAIGGRAAILARTSTHATGTVAVPSAGMTGSVDIFAARPDRMLFRITLGGIGLIEEGFDGKVGWSLSPMTGPALVQGKELEQRRFESDFLSDLHADSRYQSMTTVEKLEFDGRPCYKLRLVRPGGGEEFEFYDVKTGLKAGEITTRETPMGPITSTTVASDYSQFGPLLHARHHQVHGDGTAAGGDGDVDRVRQRRRGDVRGAGRDKGPVEVTRGALVASALWLAGTLQAAPQSVPPAETFDRAWAIVRDSHFDPRMNGVDWDAVRVELRPRAARASDAGELRAVIREMLGRLGQSHFALLASSLDSPRADPVDGSGDPGFDIRLAGRDILVTSVDAWRRGRRRRVSARAGGWCR